MDDLGFREYFAEDAVYIDPLLSEPVRGRRAIRDVMAYCHEWGHYQGEIRNIFGGGDFVAAEQRIRGTVVKPNHSVPTHRDLDQTVVEPTARGPQ